MDIVIHNFFLVPELLNHAKKTDSLKKIVCSFYCVTVKFLVKGDAFQTQLFTILFNPQTKKLP